jgi:hypothetical protein
MSADPTAQIAALVIVILRKWLQPSGFTQNVERTHRIVSGQGMIFQAIGMITSRSPHDNALDRRGQRSTAGPAVGRAVR